MLTAVSVQRPNTPELRLGVYLGIGATGNANLSRALQNAVINQPLDIPLLQICIRTCTPIQASWQFRHPDRMWNAFKLAGHREWQSLNSAFMSTMSQLNDVPKLPSMWPIIHRADGERIQKSF